MSQVRCAKLGLVNRRIGLLATRASLIAAGAFGVTLAVPWAGAGADARAGAGAPAQISITSVPHRTTLPTTPRTTASTVPVSSTKVTGTTRPGSPTTRSVATTAAGGGTGVGPGISRPAVSTTTIPTTTTTIQGINGRVPVVAATLPLHTTGSNGHVSPVFAWLSGVGLAIALVAVGARLFVTRSGGRDRAPLT